MFAFYIFTFLVQWIPFFIYQIWFCLSEGEKREVPCSTTSWSGGNIVLKCREQRWFVIAEVKDRFSFPRLLQLYIDYPSIYAFSSHAYYFVVLVCLCLLCNSRRFLLFIKFCFSLIDLEMNQSSPVFSLELCLCTTTDSFVYFLLLEFIFTQWILIILW